MAPYWLSLSRLYFLFCCLFIVHVINSSRDYCFIRAYGNWNLFSSMSMVKVANSDLNLCFNGFASFPRTRKPQLHHVSFHDRFYYTQNSHSTPGSNAHDQKLRVGVSTFFAMELPSHRLATYRWKPNVRALFYSIHPVSGPNSKLSNACHDTSLNPASSASQVKSTSTEHQLVICPLVVTWIKKVWN